MSTTKIERPKNLLTPFLSKFHIWHHFVWVCFVVKEIMRIGSVWSTIWQVHEKWFILFMGFCISWLNNWLECRDVFRNVINSSFWNLVYVCVYLCGCKSQNIVSPSMMVVAVQTLDLSWIILKIEHKLWVIIYDS